MNLSAEKFYLPYQFVQVTGKCNGKDVPLASVEALKTGSCETGKAGAGARHDVWLKGHRSGRIVCRLTTETPTFVGAKRQADTAPVEVSHATDARDGQGMPIIPGSSLRGMIGSIVETLSQSALRVLEPRTMSVRAQMKEALSAIGMIARDPITGEMVLQPLTLPVLHGTPTGDQYVFDIPINWARLYRIDANGKMDIGRFLPFYFDGYDQRTNNKNDGIKVRKNSMLSEVLGSAPNFRNDDIYSLASGSIPNVHVVVSHGRGSESVVRIKLEDKDAAYIKPSKNLNTLIGSSPCDKSSEVKLEPCDFTDDIEVWQGRLRILDMQQAMASVPGTKYHEIFVPLPTGNVKTIKFGKDVVEDFCRICKDRYDESERKFPFVALGGASAAERAPDSAWLREGDLVYFDINARLQVTRVSFSSIWRRPIPGNIHGAFDRVGKRGDSRPAALSPYNVNRNYLSPAETLLGVVRESKKSEAEKGSKDPLPALASRLRFHDARLTSGSPRLAREPVTLQILSSPKPPSPAFYFQGNVSKQQLDLNDYKPQGRKFYLHHPKQQIDAAMYVSRHDDLGLRKQKTRIRPLLPGNAFEFHVDFENLSDAELHLLLTSLRPAVEFRHRIGMGKPLGLGTVRVDVLGVFEVDRTARYGSDNLDSPRYATSWIASDPGLRIDDAQRYAIEASAVATFAGMDLRQGDYKTLLGASGTLVDAASLSALCNIGAWADGQPLALEEDIAVCYPRAHDQLAAFVKGPAGDPETAEAELFKWNVENDQRGSQYQCLQPTPVMKKPMQPLSARSTERADGPKGAQGNRPQGGKPPLDHRPGTVRR
jgi:hypothetical protein